MPFADDDSEAPAAKIVAINRVLLEQRGSEVKAVQVLVDKLNAIMNGEVKGQPNP